MTAFAIAKLFASSALVSIDANENAKELILEIYMESLEKAFMILSREKKMALSEKKIQSLKNEISQNLKEIEKEKAKASKQIDPDEDLN